MVERNAHNKDLTRRQFLRFIAFATFISSGTYKSPQIAEYLLRNPDRLDFTLNALEYYYTNKGNEVARSTYRRDPQPNSQRQSLLKIVQEGVRLYGKPVSYTFYEQRKSDELWDEKISNLASQINGVDLVQFIQGDLYASTKIQNTSDQIVSYESDTDPSTLNSILGANYTIYSLEDLKKTPHSSFYNKSDQDVQGLINKLDTLIKKIGSQNPISTSFILNFFLQQSIGNLSMAIQDTALFVKLYARNDLTSGKWLGSDHKNKPIKISRYKNIRDEFLPMGEHFMEDMNIDNSKEEPDLDTNNLLGSTYHAWDTLATMRMLPPRLTAKASIVRVLEAYQNQGNYKIASIAHVARQLPQIERYLSTLK
ncbi:MAG: hypothetical protein WCO06_02085 [Candidatus Roizmanbacteria bacterium]